MSALLLAVRNGFRDRHDLETSSVYNPLRPRSDFQRLVHDVEAREAAGGRG
jgi:hypothetical protein